MFKDTADVYHHINQMFHKDSPRPEPVPDWEKFSSENVDRLLVALKQGYKVKKYNEYAGKNKFTTVLQKEGKQEIAVEADYPWPITFGPSKDGLNEQLLIQFLEDLKIQIGNLKKDLPDHLL